MNTKEQELVIKMIDIYKPNGFDWMGTPITKKNPLSYHHIIKKDSNNTTLSNGALLTKNSHRKLNIIESKNPDLFDEWQWLFYAINESYTHPSYAYYEMMDELREQTNKEIYKSKLLTLRK